MPVNLKGNLLALAAGAALAVMAAAVLSGPAAKAQAQQAATALRPESETFSNGQLNLVIQNARRDGRSEFWIGEVQLKLPDGPRTLLCGIDGQEFSTSLGGANAMSCQVVRNDATGVTLRMSCRQDGWEAEETIEMAAGRPVLERRQTYRFLKACEGSVHPGFTVKAESDVRYTYPMWIHDQPLRGATPLSRPVDWADGGEPGVLRQPADWAVPLPMHVWHDRRCVALYGLDKSTSPGTIDFTPAAADGLARLRVYYPDSFPEAIPGTTKFAAGATLGLTEVIAARPLKADEDPLLEAERIAASILLRSPPHPADLKTVAQGIEDYFKHCELWEPNALGPGRGWFRNVWLHTESPAVTKTGPATGLFDLGWGEGQAVYFWSGAVRHWQRTGDASLLPYVDEMTKNIDFFRRGKGPAALYFDRWDGKQLGDYTCTSRIWTHSVGETGCILLQLYQSVPDYANAETRRHWLAAGTAIGNFLAEHQKPDGDLQDIFDPNDKEGSTSAHRCSARVVVCGLWTRLGQVTGRQEWTRRALRLAKAVAPEIKRYEFYNEMMDHCLHLDSYWIPAHRSPRAVSAEECASGNGAFRALEGLVPLYAATRDREVLSLCKATAAYAIAGTYFYDIPKPKTRDGIARGGTCCCNQFPLIFVIGPDMGVEPLVSLAKLSGDPLYAQMAGEMTSYIANSQKHCPGKPWNGALVHAFSQNSGKHWCNGIVDTGMSSGNGLAAIEAWLAHEAQAAPQGR